MPFALPLASRNSKILVPPRRLERFFQRLWGTATDHSTTSHIRRVKLCNLFSENMKSLRTFLWQFSC